MAESVSQGPLINSCFFHLQKLELELKCPMCLNLLKRPMLLPCDHLFCSSCISRPSDSNMSCPICAKPIRPEDTKLASHMENLVNVFRNMSAAFSANFGQPRTEAIPSESKRPINTNQNYGEQIVEEQTQNPSMPREGIQSDQAQCSPPSCAGPKYSDDDSNDQGSVHESDCIVNITDYLGQTPELKDGQRREPKRLKLTSEDVSKSSMTEKSTLFINTFNESDNKVVINAPPCVFCQSCEESKASGPMLHYVDGEPVEIKDAACDHALHVHQKCIEWAPQVYFVEDKAHNLDAEISRASKIKCSKCGKKGAALGCYSTSCRKSFHVPCAVDIPGCRWDSDNFLLLCPSHADRKLPNDKSKRRKSTEIDDSHLPNNVSKIPKTDVELWSVPPEVTRDWVLCGSALSPGDKDIMAKFASLTGVTLTKDWRPTITHVIASTDSSGACSRTLKFLMAILSGKWIVTIEWIKACLNARRPVEENDFEVSHDIHGCFDGPKNGRIRVLEQAPKLFSGLSFNFTGDFMPTYKGYLKDLIFAAGGELVEETSKMPKSTGYLVYSVDPPLEVTGDYQGVLDRRLLAAKAAAARIGAQVVPHTWVLDSIAACKVQSIF